MMDIIHYKPRKNVFFYDDDPINIMEVSKLNIKSTLIAKKYVNLNYKERHNYHKNFVNNTYYEYFKPLGTPTDGFNMKHAESLLLSLQTISSLLVLFDWDRTVTCFDGFSIENEPFTYSSRGVKIQDVMEYICGGYARLNFLSYIFQMIRKHKGEIFILTNNPVVVYNKNEFIKMIRSIDPHFKEKCLIYGNGNKRLALLSCNYFMNK
jgi:hypothetical protein